MTRLSRTCDECGADFRRLLGLHAKCHPNAPLGLSYRKTPRRSGRGILSVHCYVPDCDLFIASFGVRETCFPEGASRRCDLCDDNVAGRIATADDHALLEFTAPFRLEALSADGKHVLVATCYGRECGRQFALFELTKEKQSR